MRSNMLVQQARVMRGSRVLGAQVLARVQQVRNVVAVRLDAVRIYAARMDAARAGPGVRSVRLVRDIKRAPPASKTSRWENPDGWFWTCLSQHHAT